MKLDLAIKFGSHEIIIYRKGYGVIAKEPAFLAVGFFGKRMIPKAVGTNAEKLKNNKSSGVVIYQPIKNGKVEDGKLATVLIRNILEEKIVNRFQIAKINALVAVPCAIKTEQLILIKQVLMEAGINRITYVPNGACVREFEKLLPAEAKNITVDIGKYITDISILSKKEFIAGRDYQIGGADMDIALQTYIKDNFDLHITAKQAEEIKAKLVTLYENDTYSTTFTGLDENKNPKQCTITASEVRIAVIGVYNKICELITDYIHTFPEELVAEIYKNGIIFTGGSAKIQGLYEYATEKLKMPVIELDNPVEASLLGLSDMLDRPVKSLVKIHI